MNLISLTKVKKTAGPRILYEDVTFGIQEGEKTALIGRNGSGKSTLFSLIKGTDEPDSGEVVRNRELRMAYLSQSPVYRPDQSLMDFVLQTSGKAEYEVHSILKLLGITGITRKMGELSGGQVRKADLAVTLSKVISGDADLLLLDEPTNHLDVVSIARLEDFLADLKTAVFMITHDRYFLENVADTILEIDRGHITRYPGQYSVYLEKKEAEREAERKTEAKNLSYLRREIDWIRRQPQARGTKQKARIDRFDQVTETEKNRMADPEKLQLETTGARIGKTLLETEDLCFQWLQPSGAESETDPNNGLILDKFTYKFAEDDRIGILGPNGSGKSTLLDILAGIYEPEASSSAYVFSGIRKCGQTVKIAYFDQLVRELNPEERVIDYLKREGGESLKLAGGETLSPVDMLEKFLFPSDAAYRSIGLLSGGEKRRLYLVMLLLRNPNFIILDEPTNDLDIPTRSVLEDFLNTFRGPVVVVSHDRYFLDRTARKIFIMEGKGKVKAWSGSASEAIRKIEIESGNESGIPAPEKPKPSPDVKTSLNHAERKELRSLEASIEKAEAELKMVESEAEKAGSDYEALSAALEKAEKLKKELDFKVRRWEELAERA